ncbi:MAG TPA: hypothetical protein VNA19_13705 [Pyrinomonadaceae bacterium]|jgi:hypothetical protein|nr:hypothetical protein [Pyrinomonadaceae bacterium]
MCTPVQTLDGLSAIGTNAREEIILEVSTILIVAAVALGLLAALARGLWNTPVSRLTEAAFDAVEYALALRKYNRALYAQQQTGVRDVHAEIYAHATRPRAVSRALTSSATLRLQRDRFAA